MRYNRRGGEMMHRRILGLILLMVLLLDAGAAWAGDITGGVVINSKIRARKTGKTLKWRPQSGYGGYDAHKAPPPDDETRYVVVYVEKVDGGKFTVPSAHPQMIQEGKEFKPHVLAVVAGQTVDFPNNDKIY